MKKTSQSLLNVIQEIEKESSYPRIKDLTGREFFQFIGFSVVHFIKKLINKDKLLSKYLKRASSNQKTYLINGSVKSELQRKFQEDGVIGPYPLSEISKGNLSFLKDLTLNYEGVVFPHLRNKTLFDLTRDEGILSRVREILGPDVDVARSSVFIKHPGKSKQKTRWHMATPINYGAKENIHDSHYLTIWIALTDVSINQAPVCLIPRSFGVYPQGLLPKISSGEVLINNAFDAFLYKGMIKNFSKGMSPTVRKSAFQVFTEDRVNAAVAIQRVLMCNQFLQENLREKAKEPVALTCKKGEFFIFSSENYHSSLEHLANDVRVAFVIRFAKREAIVKYPEFIKSLVDTIPSHLKNLIQKNSDKPLCPMSVACGSSIQGENSGKYYFLKEEIFNNSINDHNDEQEVA